MKFLHSYYSTKKKVLYILVNSAHFLSMKQ